jgi:hypothetical protein
VHLDVEPQANPAFATSDAKRTELLQQYADFVSLKARPMTQAAKIPLEMDIAYWFEGYKVNDNSVSPAVSMPLNELLTKYMDTVAVMSYVRTRGDTTRDANEIMNVCKEEIASAKKYDKKIVLSVHCGPEDPDVSYINRGKNYMNEALLKVKERLDIEFPNKKYGLAIHYMAAWYNLPVTQTSLAAGAGQISSSSANSYKTENASSNQDTGKTLHADNGTEKDGSGCNAASYGYLVFALLGIAPLVFRKK